MPIAVISPAKALNESAVPDVSPTEPEWSAAHTAELLTVCHGLSKQQIKSLMSLSDPLAALNHDRFQNFSSQASKPAAWAFDGPAHKALDIASLTAQQQDYAQQHILTLSGLYGCLRPRDAIRPYRLEMGTKLGTGRGGTLYEFWADAVAAEIKLRLQALPREQQFIVNVASEEYWGVVGKRAAAVLGDQFPVYTIKFPGPSVYAKQARGLFCRFMCQRAVSTPEDLNQFAAWTSECAGAVYALTSVNGTTIEFARTAATGSGQPTKAPKKAPAKKAPKKGATQPPKGQPASKASKALHKKSRDDASTKPTIEPSRKSKRIRKD